MNSKEHVMIIGGGASGMMAALTASERPERSVLLLERQTRTGRKLLATGNGRCNLSNRRLSPAHYHGEQPGFVRPALEAFDSEAATDYFRSLGLLTVTEPSGRVYPASDSANSVADVLRLTLCQRPNVTVRTASEVLSLRRDSAGFAADTAETTFRADRAIVCAGGLAGTKLGGVDLGYRLLQGLGHRRTRLYPALVQVRTETGFVRSLKGVRCDAEVRYGREVRRGELQFTEYGVSGPVIFELSRSISVCGGGELTLDLLPVLSEEELLALLRARCAALPALPAEELLTGVLHNRLGRSVLRACGYRFEQSCASVDDLPRICRAVKRFSLRVEGVMGMDAAQVTAGGIRTADFDPQTLQSRLCPGLYAAGEVLDVDGDCGGYNLQWAWASGRLAGKLLE